MRSMFTPAGRAADEERRYTKRILSFSLLIVYGHVLYILGIQLIMIKDNIALAGQAADEKGGGGGY